MYKIKKIYYDNSTGEILHHCTYDQVVPVDFDHDYNTVIDLNIRLKETIELLILKDGAYAQDFSEGRLIGVNLETKVPIFEYYNPENPSEPIVTEKPLSVEVSELKAENERLMQEDLNNKEAIAELYILSMGGY